MSINYHQSFVSQNPTIGTPEGNSSSGLALDDAYVYNSLGKAVGCRFIMPKTTQSLTTVYFFGTITGGSPADITVEIRNAETITKPGSTLLASVNVTPGSNWHTADFSGSPPTLTEGEFYFVCFGLSAFSASDEFNIIRYGASSGLIDDWKEFFRLIFTFDGFSTQDSSVEFANMIVLKFADGSLLGHPYKESPSYSSNTLERGFKIVNLPYDMTVYGINFATSATVNMEAIKIYENEDLPTGTPIFTHLLDVSEQDTSTDILFEPFTFVANKTYRLVFSWDSASTTPGYFEIASPGGNQDLLDAGFASGLIYETIEDGVGGWTDNTNRFPQAGLLLAGAGSATAITSGTIESDLITRSRSLFQLGTLVTQIAPFTGAKTLHKASIDLAVTNANATTFVIGSNGVVSFQAANFYDGRDTWAFHPVLHWSSSKNWQTSGLSIENTLQTESYSTSTVAAADAPFLKHRLFLDVAGVYNLWGYGFTSGGVFWSWDDDTTDMRQFTLGDAAGPPQWTKFGTIESPAGGVHTFSVYLSDAANVVLDQWYFTTSTADLSYPFAPLTLSKAPFTTGIRVRSLDGGSLDDLEGPSGGSVRAVAWMPSKNVTASGKYNYELQNDSVGSGVTFTDGASIDIWQTGGSFEHFAAWDFVLTDSSIGDAFTSTDYGQTFTSE